MVYSEAGGVSKTTTAVSLAMTSAEMGKRTVLVDLDPRAASTKWLNVSPKSDGLDVGAILGNENVEGWAEDLAVPSGWSPNLRVITSGRSVSIREGERADHAELRLKSSLIGLKADVVVIDCPNRQGGPLILSALNASDTVIYAARPTTDGVDGVLGARQSVLKFIKARNDMGAPSGLVEAGIIIGDVKTVIEPRIQVASIDNLKALGLVLFPTVPERTIVREMRETHEWYDRYRKGGNVADAYRELAKQVLR